MNTKEIARLHNYVEPLIFAHGKVLGMVFINNRKTNKLNNVRIWFTGEFSDLDIESLKRHLTANHRKVAFVSNKKFECAMAYFWLLGEVIENNEDKRDERFKFLDKEVKKMFDSALENNEDPNDFFNKVDMIMFEHLTYEYAAQFKQLEPNEQFDMLAKVNKICANIEGIKVRGDEFNITDYYGLIK